MSGAEWIEEARKTLYACGSCGVTMFGRSIPGGTVIARMRPGGLIDFTCPNCPEGMLEPVVAEVPPQSWRPL